MPIPSNICVESKFEAQAGEATAPDLTGAGRSLDDQLTILSHVFRRVLPAADIGLQVSAPLFHPVRLPLAHG